MRLKKKEKIEIVDNPGELICAMYRGQPVIYNGVIWRTVDMGLATKPDLNHKRYKSGNKKHTVKNVTIPKSAKNSTLRKRSKRIHLSTSIEKKGKCKSITANLKKQDYLKA